MGSGNLCFFLWKLVLLSRKSWKSVVFRVEKGWKSVVFSCKKGWKSVVAASNTDFHKVFWGTDWHEVLWGLICYLSVLDWGLWWVKTVNSEQLMLKNVIFSILWWRLMGCVRCGEIGAWGCWVGYFAVFWRGGACGGANVIKSLMHFVVKWRIAKFAVINKSNAKQTHLTECRNSET